MDPVVGQTIAGFTRTGRQLLGPGSDLVEVQAPDGRRLTAILFHPEYRSHNAINAALQVVVGYLESPMVSGLADLVAQDREQAAFLYPTGQVWSVAEVIRTLSDLGESGGPRAGLELLAEVGTVVVEAAETGESAGVYSHGGLTPWRVMLDGEGRVTVIGHALPQVEILVFHESPDRIPREDAFRYCPPERMESRRENFTSDLFGLGLIAFELMTGRPVYDGLINDIRTKAARGETSRRLQQFKDALPAAVRELLTTTLRPELRDRYQSGEDFLAAVKSALADRSVTGPGLRESMQRVARHQPRARQELDPGRTSMLSKEELKRLASEEDDTPAPRPARGQFMPPAPPPPATRPPVLAPTPSIISAPMPRASMPSRGPVAARPPEAPLAAPAATPAPVAQAAPPTEPAPVTPGNGLPAARRPPRLAGTTSGDRLAPAADRSPAPPPVAAPPPVPSAAPPPGSPIGGARLPPSRRPPPALAPPPVAAPPPVVHAAPAPPQAGTGAMADLLRKSGDSAREARDRVERAMRTSGGSEARVEPPPAPAPPVVPGASPLAVGGFVQAEEASGAHRPLPGPAPQRFAQPHAPVRAPLPPPPPVPANEEITKPSAASVAIEDDDDPPTGPSAGPAPVPVATTSPAQRAAAPAPVATPASRPTPPPPPALAAVVPASVPAAAPPPLPAAPPSPPAPKSPPIVAIRPAAPIPSPPAASMGLRAPIPLRPPGRGEAVAVRFSRAPGLRGHRRRLPGDTTLAEAAQQLVGQLVPLRVSADGRLLGWYRIGTEEGPLPVDHDVASLDDEANHPLHFVENRVAWFKVVAEGRAFQLAVGLAVPVASLVDALAVQLDLPDTSWLLELDGIGLDDFHILADHPTTPLSVLTLRRGPG